MVCRGEHTRTALSTQIKSGFLFVTHHFKMKEAAVYTCGRMHKPARKAKLSAAKANALLGRLHGIMKMEIITSGEMVSLLQSELLSAKFASETMESNVSSRVPLLWLPSKPNVTLALIDILTSAHNTDDSNVHPCAGANGLTKLLARHMVATLLARKGMEWLKQCGELTIAQLESPSKTRQTLSRAAFDMIVYVHARAEEIRQRDGGEAILELQSSDETLRGRDLRGCGVVYCKNGRTIFAAACERVRETLQYRGNSADAVCV